MRRGNSYLSIEALELEGNDFVHDIQLGRRLKKGDNLHEFCLLLN